MDRKQNLSRKSTEWLETKLSAAKLDKRQAEEKGAGPVSLAEWDKWIQALEKELGERSETPQPVSGGDDSKPSKSHYQLAQEAIDALPEPQEISIPETVEGLEARKLSAEETARRIQRAVSGGNVPEDAERVAGSFETLARAIREGQAVSVAVQVTIWNPPPG